MNVIDKLVDFIFTNKIYSALVMLWVITIWGTSENVLTGSDSLDTLMFVIFVPGLLFLALIPLKSAGVHEWLISRFNPPSKIPPRLKINKKPPIK